MASGQKVHQRPTEIKTALHGVALPIHYSDLNAVLKPVYTQPWRLNRPCLGSAPPINILLFSQTCQLIFKREKHCIVINLISPCVLLCLCLWFRALGQPAPALLAGGLAWGAELGSPRWGKVSLCSAVAFHCQPLGDSCDSPSHDRLLAQQWTLCALPSLLQPQLPPNLHPPHNFPSSGESKKQNK